MVRKDNEFSRVKVGFDGRVHKTFRGLNAAQRFETEVAVLRHLEERGCDYVPRLLASDPTTLTIVTSNCGAPAEASISDGKAAELFEMLEREYGVVHDDPFPRNITYNARQGVFCIIDFELAEVKEDPQHRCDDEEAHRTLEWCGLTRDGNRKPGNQDALSVFSSEQGWANSADLGRQITAADTLKTVVLKVQQPGAEGAQDLHRRGDGRVRVEGVEVGVPVALPSALHLHEVRAGAVVGEGPVQIPDHRPGPGAVLGCRPVAHFFGGLVG